MRKENRAYSIRLLVAINNRSVESFITNLLTKFIFNSFFLLLVIPSFDPLQIY